MTVTVLIPTIAPGAWLDLAVTSALDSDSESLILVVFDGSEPAADAAWLADPRVSVHRLPSRGGLAAALNAGLRRATTPYVARLDADDIAMPGRFASQRSYLDAHPEAPLVSGAAACIDESGTITGHIGPRHGHASDDMRTDLLLRNYLIHPAVMYRRQAVLDVGAYDETLPFMEDYELWLRLACVGPLAMTTDEVIHYRLHANQMTKAAPPHGVHIRRIGAAKRRLAATIGVPRALSAAYHSLWLAAQVRRFVTARIRAAQAKRA